MNPKRIAFFILVLISLLGVGFSIYLYIQWNSEKGRYNNLKEEFGGLELVYKEATDQLKGNQEAQNAEKLSSKYETFTLLSKCGIGLSYPDRTKEFNVNGANAVWELSSRVYDKENQSSGDYSVFKDGTSYILNLSYTDSGIGTDFNPGYIAIKCATLKEGETLESVSNKLITSHKKVNSDPVNEEMTGVKGSTLKVEKVLEENKWGTTVFKLSIAQNFFIDSVRDNDYLFINGNKVVLVTSDTGSTDKKVLRSIDNIINSIYRYK